jgi:putative ABC transport system ATP-binding protein
MRVHENAPIIRVSGLSKSIDTGTHCVEILRGVSFEVPRGQFVSIMGPSGSGKSTLLALLAGLDTASAGNIFLDGVDITLLKEDLLADLRGRKIGFVFQSYQLIPTLTAEENVMLPADIVGSPDGASRARELLASVGLEERRDHYPVQLSGGEQQRVALARAFMVRPPILLADEPTGNLDSQNGRQILELLLKLNRQENTTLVLVTHDHDLADCADRIIALRDGEIVADDTRAVPTATAGPGDEAAKP